MSKINPASEEWRRSARQNHKKYKKWLSSNDAKKSIKTLPSMHEGAFENIDCLDCASCCKNISPRFKVPDIKRISKYLGLKESVMIEQYLRVDEEGDFVVQSSPCPFLLEDNHCHIYDVRPRDCQNYPYTNSDQFVKRPNTTLQNSNICPAVYWVLEKIME